MNYNEFIKKYNGYNFEVFIFASYLALEETIGEEKMDKFVQQAVNQIADYKNAENIIDKLVKNN